MRRRTPDATAWCSRPTRSRPDRSRQGNRANRRKARGFAPGPHQGALPLGSPPRAMPLEPSTLVRRWEGGRCRRRHTGDRRCDGGGTGPPPISEPKRMDCKGIAFTGGRGGKAPWRVSGRSPDLPFVCPTALSIGPRPVSRPRTASRVAAVQALFQSEQSGDNPESVIDQFVRHRLGAVSDAGGFEDGRAPHAEVKLFMRIVRAAVLSQERIDGLIVESLPADWPIARIDPVLRALLRAGGAELAMLDGPPTRVVINEYLDVAHGFFTGDEPGLANAVLDRLARALRPAEFAE